MSCAVIVKADEDFLAFVSVMLACSEEFLFLFMREPAAESGADLKAFLFESEGIKDAFRDDEVVVFDVMSFECFEFACIGIDAGIFFDEARVLRMFAPDGIFEEHIKARVVEFEFLIFGE